MVMMRFVPTGCNAHVGRPRCHPIPHPLRNSIPLENVPDFIAKIKFSPNLIVEVCPVYGGQKQVGAFGCIVLVRIQNVEFHGLQWRVKQKSTYTIIRHWEILFHKIFTDNLRHTERVFVRFNRTSWRCYRHISCFRSGGGCCNDVENLI